MIIAPKIGRGPRKQDLGESASTPTLLCVRLSQNMNKRLSKIRVKHNGTPVKHLPNSPGMAAEHAGREWPRVDDCRNVMHDEA
jgi:hypothetical protein